MRKGSDYQLLLKKFLRIFFFSVIFNANSGIPCSLKEQLVVVLLKFLTEDGIIFFRLFKSEILLKRFSALLFTITSGDLNVSISLFFPD